MVWIARAARNRAMADIDLVRPKEPRPTVTESINVPFQNNAFLMQMTFPS